jgi:hypothetical protein
VNSRALKYSDTRGVSKIIRPNDWGRIVIDDFVAVSVAYRSMSNCHMLCGTQVRESYRRSSHFWHVSDPRRKKADLPAQCGQFIMRSQPDFVVSVVLRESMGSLIPETGSP